MTGPLRFPPPDKSVCPLPRRPATRPAEKAEAAGADDVGALVDQVCSSRLRGTVEALAAFHTRHTSSPLIHDAADRLVAEFTAAGYPAAVKLPWVRNGRTADNVVATKTGDGDAIVIVCAHYDSRAEDLSSATVRAPGADDNASGVAAVLEIARLLAGVELSTTVQFVAFSGEEQGLLGSAAYAEALHAAGTDVHRVINLDMVGRPPDDGSVVVERDLGNVVATNDADSQAFGALMVQAAHDYTDLPVQLGPIYASDYMPFEAKGYVAVGAYEGEGNPHYHRTSDTPDTLDYDYLAAVTRMVLATVLRAWRVVGDGPARTAVGASRPEMASATGSTSSKSG